MKKTIGILSICICLLLSTQQLVTASQYEDLLSSTNYERILSKGLKYGKNGEKEKAVKLFEHAIELDPNNIDGYAGKIYFLENDAQDRFVKETLKRFPEDSDLRIFLSRMYLKQNNEAKAILPMEEITKIRPKDYKPYIMLAQLYIDKNDYKSAINVYNRAKTIFPTKNELYFACAKICGDIEDYQCSLENAQKLVELNPANPDFYAYRATYRMITEDLDGALADLDKATALLGEETANISADKAEVYYRKGDFENTKKYLLKALEKDKNNPTANGLLAIWAYDNEHYETTIKAANKCLKFNNGYIYPVRYWKTKALYKLGRTNEALKEADKLINETPFNQRYIKLKQDIINKNL